MSRPWYSVKHVESKSLLPTKLTRGRAYFVDDEQVIVIDHGLGPVIYGGKPGPQGQAGEPLPQIQGQLDSLAAASLTMQSTFWENLERQHKSEARAEAAITEASSFLQGQVNLNAQGILTVTELIYRKFKEYDAAVSTLTKTLAELYPEEFRGKGGDGKDPLDDVVVTTPEGRWKVQQTVLQDGTIVLELDAQELRIERLKVGDRVDYDGSTWTVSEYERSEDGTISLTISA